MRIGSIYIVKLLLFIFALTAVSAVSAHPGRTDSSGCHTCKTNCEKWGLSYGEYHCHNGGSGPAPVYPTSTPRPLPTWTSIPTVTIKPTRKPTVKQVKKVKKAVAKKKVQKPTVTPTPKKSFFQMLFGG